MGTQRDAARRVTITVRVIGDEVHVLAGSAEDVHRWLPLVPVLLLDALEQPDTSIDRLGWLSRSVSRTDECVGQRTDRAIEFAGRVDHHAKIRGFRIPLGEIEAVLQQVSGLTEAAIVASGTGNDRWLNGFFIADRPVDLDNSVRDFARYVAIGADRRESRPANVRAPP